MSLPSDFDPSAAAGHAAPRARLRPSFWKRLLASKFLLVSVIFHVLFGLGATYFIVSSVQAKRKVTFQGGPPTTNPSKRALEHKVSMAQKKKSGGAPPQAKRIVSSGLSKISLPEMPSLPSATTIVPGMAAGMGGAGFGTGMGIGNGMGSGMGGGGGGGGGMTMFGFRQAKSGTLLGEFYDLKMTRSKKPTPIATDTAAYYAEVRKYVERGWADAVLNDYFKASIKLYTTQVYVPIGVSEEAAKAFGVEKESSGPKWIVHYQGKVLGPEDGEYRFIGMGDNILFVRIKGKTVLDYVSRGKGAADGAGPAGPVGWQFASGEWFKVTRGEAMNLEVIIGDSEGFFAAYLAMEKKGETYTKRSDAPGYPAYPIFQTSKGKVPKHSDGPGGANPEFAKEPIVFPGSGGPMFGS